MKRLKLTSAQAQSIIFALDQPDTPVMLDDFYIKNVDTIFETNNPVTIELNYTAKKWLKSMLKARNKTLKQMIIESKEADLEYWIDEAKANERNVLLAERILAKLDKL